MKKLFTILSAAIFSFSSCNIIGIEPISDLTEVNFYRTADDMNRAVIGVYSGYQARLPSDWYIMEMPSDHLYMSAFRFVAGLEAMTTLDFQPANDILLKYWQASYRVIYRANAVLQNIDNPSDYSGSLKTQLEGEAKFMRALAYFDLVRVFGGVPRIDRLLSISESQSTPRASEAEIYDLIVSDLQRAIEILPDKANIAKGRASKGSATALLGKVYVYRKDWPNAYSQLNAVTGYGLVDNYADLWSPNHEDNQEGVFVIKYLANANGNPISVHFLPNHGVEGITGSAGGEYALPAWSVLKKFEEADTRKAATFTEYWRSPGSGAPLSWKPYVSKFQAQNATSSGLDMPVIRYADVLLLKAEALYRLERPEEALVELNKIRTRAFGGTSHNYTLADIATPEAFLDVLLLERQLELAYENQRWFDLVRTDRYMQALTNQEWSYNPTIETPERVTLNPLPRHRVFPIPQHEIDQAQPGVLIQNENY